MNQLLIVVLTTISAMVVMAGTALAQSPNLVGKTWMAINECDLSIDFKSDGTAEVVDTSDFDGNHDSAHWTLDGNALHLKYDHWFGGIDGTVTSADHIEATETTRSGSTHVVRYVPCKLNK